ncbi:MULTISPECIES: formimidoylglutamate deiminase [unclassified Massilia]|uniref:formimidoylglutamate deiminase n=1 Tax=unclassified Massilia TaxID=2609279 RepID=UPI00177B9E80|nr:MULTISPECIES: formimidoylglutamate deiminase [unclassified Massilia]MBD8532888.1 formimidoylglutamate deiminase [Massilia sp. CFBP 13647]MBD8676249.1 formimidoylglutamate deiminase [Massilia sp. CFBP 13721]
MNALFARHALLPEGWQGDVLVEWDARGTLTRVQPQARPPIGVARAEYVVPGMVNLHSHAFQRALGGLTERVGEGPDSFWTWRDLMYRFAAQITPEQVEAIGAQLFSECLRHGYTALCEFHYIQRDPRGHMYARPAEMAERVAAAGQQAGIGLTLLPVLYSYSGFGAQPLKPEQARFYTDVDTVLSIVEALEPLRGGQLEVGAAPHSLRAAGIDQIHALMGALPQARPLHIHIAEQQAEVQQSLDFSGRRPVDYLFDAVEIDARWCLVHATHLNDKELGNLARSGAVAGLCPSTEANLGDGLFPLGDYLANGGRWGIGSDSHVSQSPIEELRWLEYGQRLLHQRRNIVGAPARRDVALNLWQDALGGGAQAAGRPVGALAAGRRADLLVLDATHPNLDGVRDTDVLGRLVFCGNDNLVRDVLAGGRWVVQGGRHMAQEAIGRRYRQAIQELREVSA